MGVKRITTVGTVFDPNLHEAVSQAESEKEADTILEEVQAGYQVNDSVIRPAKVVVSK